MNEKGLSYKEIMEQERLKRQQMQTEELSAEGVPTLDEIAVTTVSDKDIDEVKKGFSFHETEQSIIKNRSGQSAISRFTGATRDVFHFVTGTRSKDDPVNRFDNSTSVSEAKDNLVARVKSIKDVPHAILAAPSVLVGAVETGIRAVSNGSAWLADKIRGDTKWPIGGLRALVALPFRVAQVGTAVGASALRGVGYALKKGADYFHDRGVIGSLRGIAALPVKAINALPRAISKVTGKIQDFLVGSEKDLPWTAKSTSAKIRSVLFAPLTTAAKAIEGNSAGVPWKEKSGWQKFRSVLAAPVNFFSSPIKYISKGIGKISSAIEGNNTPRLMNKLEKQREKFDREIEGKGARITALANELQELNEVLKGKEGDTENIGLKNIIERYGKAIEELESKGEDKLTAEQKEQLDNLRKGKECNEKRQSDVENEIAKKTKGLTEAVKQLEARNKKLEGLVEELNKQHIRSGSLKTVTHDSSKLDALKTTISGKVGQNVLPSSENKGKGVGLEM